MQIDPEMIGLASLVITSVAGGLGIKVGQGVSRKDLDELRAWLVLELEPVKEFVRYAKWREEYEAEMEEKKSVAAPRRVPADDVA